MLLIKINQILKFCRYKELFVLVSCDKTMIVCFININHDFNVWLSLFSINLQIKGFRTKHSSDVLTIFYLRFRLNILPYWVTSFLASINASKAVMLLLIMLVIISPFVDGLLSFVISIQMFPISSLLACSSSRNSSFRNCISSIVLNVFIMPFCLFSLIAG